MAKTNKINKLTGSIVESLKRHGIPVKYLILYGSYAHGTQKHDSDIDLAVVSSVFTGKSIVKRQELLGEALYDLGEPVEALGYSPQEYCRPPALSFLSEILSTGKLIYKI
ncbi:MAG: nucleotidyltransferase domain-containing protein [Candidatus Omnitrophota bacterium]